MEEFEPSTFRLQEPPRTPNRTHTQLFYTIHWQKYKKWLEENKQHHYAKVMYNYSITFAKLLFSQELVTMPKTRKKSDILKALANLTRFMDIQNDNSNFHEEFIRWLKRKEIKWNTTKQSNNYNLSNSFSLGKLFENLNELDEKYNLFATFMLVSGLRTNESIKAFNNHSSLCHSGIIEMFWNRRTKNANAVFCHPLLHHKINFIISEKSIRRHLNSKILGCELRYLRKINFTMVATKLDPLLAEFMQGRRGNVSQRHYFLPLMSNNRRKWIRVWEPIIKKCQFR